MHSSTVYCAQCHLPLPADDARLAIEARGIVLFKDSAANKGGVTSSSLEVLAALSLTDDEFHKHMCVAPETAAAADAHSGECVCWALLSGLTLIWQYHLRSGLYTDTVPPPSPRTCPSARVPPACACSAPARARLLQAVRRGGAADH